jgi:hypothetical protein
MIENDHLAPEPLENYQEFVEGQLSQEKGQEITPEEHFRVANLDVAGPFRKIDLEAQKEWLGKPTPSYTMSPGGQDYSQSQMNAFNRIQRQVTYRETVLNQQQNKARDHFKIHSRGKDRGLDR